jgi:hypothetical protein
MTAYTSAATGSWNNSATWSPSGIPTSADTVAVGGHTITIPNGYAAQVGAMTLTGTGSGTRASIQCTGGGSLKHFGAVTCDIWNEFSFISAGTFTWDLNGQNVTYLQQSTSSIHNRIVCDGTVFLYLKSTAAESTIMAAGFQSSDGFLDIQNFKIENVSLRYGAGFFNGNHYRVRNGLFYNHGFVRSSGEIHANSDFMLKNCDFRGFSSLDGGAYCARWSGLTSAGSGVRQFQDLTFEYPSVATIRTEAFRFISPVRIYTYNVQFENVNTPTTAWTNIFHSKTIFGDLGYVDLVDSYVTPNLDNPHTFTGVKDATGLILEAIYPASPTDGGDHFILDNNPHALTNCLFIEGYGGVILNALGASKTSVYTMDHCTYVADCLDAVYGQLVRNETGGSFAAGSTLTVKNNIAYVRSGLSHSRIYNIETAGNDQVKYVDYNCYSGQGSTNSELYYQVTSATKGAIHSQVGWGLNDKISTNPNFVDSSRGIISWASQFGASTYLTAVKYLLNGVNGYNPATQLLQSNLITGKSITDLITYVRNGYAPQNIALKNAGSDGVTIGAFEYQAMPSKSKQISIGIGIGL